MEEEILKKLAVQDEKLNEIWKSVEKTRKYFLVSIIITIGTIVLPLIAAVALLPWMIKTMTAAYSGLGI
jgi:hypothetical protein